MREDSDGSSEETWAFQEQPATAIMRENSDGSSEAQSQSSNFPSRIIERENPDGMHLLSQSFSARGSERVDNNQEYSNSFSGFRRGGTYSVVGNGAAHGLFSPQSSSQKLDFLQNFQVRSTPNFEDSETSVASYPLVERSPRPDLKRLNSGSQLMVVQDDLLPSLSVSSVGERHYPRNVHQSLESEKMSLPLGASSLPTPLYEAVSSGASRGVIDSLIKADPSSTVHQNAGGLTPLHCAIERYDTPVNTLFLLLESNPGAAGLRDQKGLTPVDLLFKRYVRPDPYRSEETRERAARLRTAMTEAVGPMEHHASKGGDSKPSRAEQQRQSRAQLALKENSDLQDFWHIIVVFIRAACHGMISVPEDGGEEIRLVDDVVTLRCDALLIRFAISLYPEQLVNPPGRLPLHIAASGGRSSEAVLNLLTLLDSSAASKTASDGRLPLHLAIASGMSWEHGLEPLVKAYPQSLSTIDSISQFSPFLLAASKDVSCDLSSLYSILRASPNEIRHEGCIK